jgi:hypothetical protein
MPEYKMLDELIHYCTRCKLDLNHRIVALVEGAPKKVLCLTCQTQRVYRSKPPPARRAAMGKAAAAKQAQEDQWMQKINAGSKNPKPYSMEAVFKVDDMVQHNVFGLGVNTQNVPPDKVQVFFSDGMKLLKCGKVS